MKLLALINYSHYNDYEFGYYDTDGKYLNFSEKIIPYELQSLYTVSTENWTSYEYASLTKAMIKSGAYIEILIEEDIVLRQSYNDVTLIKILDDYSIKLLSSYNKQFSYLTKLPYVQNAVGVRKTFVRQTIVQTPIQTIGIDCDKNIIIYGYKSNLKIKDVVKIDEITLESMYRNMISLNKSLAIETKTGIKYM